MCDKVKFPVLSPRSWSWGSGRGEFSLGMLPPADFDSLLMDVDYDDLCDVFGLVEEPETFAQPEKDAASCGCGSPAEQCSVSDGSTSSAEETGEPPNHGALKVLATAGFLSSSDNRRCAIERWKVKKGRNKGLVKVCKARSEVALSRPRVKGKFIKKAQFVSVTDLQGY
eukprot:CAMPEP_0116962632 /NCGR_PEP_ID=MMETSP0467-20121206/47387_1 /TAXON_ID=283647 /ORGANISM="Mesodinium pulex, Strain SPMC105" /LENGTH=168 /DNA_ID=CAMNT_0004651019 /DNA_START=195 /DNA_END=701 /DNA_ORIENTATION=-